MLLRGAILPADHYNKQRLSLVKQQIIPPMVEAAAQPIKDVELGFLEERKLEANDESKPDELRKIAAEKVEKAEGKIKMIEAIMANPSNYITPVVLEIQFFTALDIIDDTARPIEKSQGDQPHNRKRFRFAGKMCDFSGIIQKPVRNPLVYPESSCGSRSYLTVPDGARR